MVVNYYQHEVEALDVVGDCRSFGVKAIAVQADVSKPDHAERLNEAALREFGGLDIVVANAGIWEGDAVEKMSEDLWDRVIDANLKGTWTVCRAAIPHFKENGGGTIVIVSSTAGQRGRGGIFQLCSVQRRADLVH